MTILAAIDLSETTHSVINSLPAVVNKDETIVLLHVAEPNPEFVGFDTGPKVVKEQLANEFKRQRAELQEYADTLTSRGLSVNAMQIHGAHADAITKTADELEVRMIVLGNRRHGTLYDILVGSVAESVIRHANQPVLMVPNHTD
jgi:nucleotide-binding universal stress UspA family protein